MKQILKKLIEQILYSKQKAEIEANFEYTIFRNDDVSFDSDLEHFRMICEIFHKYGFTQLHGITLYGVTNCKYIINGIPAMYATIKPEEIYDYKICKSVSKQFIGDNKLLIEYLNSIPDEIALHGLYHSDYSTMSYEQQETDIREGLRLLHELFPNKEIRTFIAPFNHANQYTYEICKKFGLRVSAEEGDHLEDMIASERGPILKNQLYRYHHHRFYPESTFSYYDLSLAKLEEYLVKNSFTVNQETGRVRPAISLLKECVEKHSAQNWYIYAYREFESRKHAWYAYEWIKKNVPINGKVLEVACGAGGMLYHLQSDGFNDLAGYDFDNNAIAAAKEINSAIEGNIKFFVDDATAPVNKGTYDVIVWVNGMYHLENYSLNNFFDKHVRLLNDNGYVIFDMVDDSFNKVDQNEFSTQDWGKEGEKRPSEYKIRMSKKDVVNIAKKYNAELIKTYSVEDIIPRTVYVFQRKRPRICLLCDRPNWAHDHSAQELKKFLNDEFCFDIKYVVDHDEISKKQYDAIMVFFWGEDYYKKFKIPKRKVIKQVSSHRWQFDEPYGPMSTESFVCKYLYDAETIICPSKILFDLLAPYVKHLYLCGKGYSANKFRYIKERTGEISLCTVGNLKDPVKGVQDILIPSAEGYKMDMVQDMKHEELLDFYNDHDVYVVASKHEADPLPLIESMACGCFPIASAIGIAPELIRHKENGYIVSERSVDEFRGAYKWCLEHLEYIREQAPRTAQEIYDNRRWELMSENYRNMFRCHTDKLT